METLGDSLPKEIERVQGMVARCEAFAELMRNDIKAAHKAMMEGDLPSMIASYKALQEWKDE